MPDFLSIKRITKSTAKGQVTEIIEPGFNVLYNLQDIMTRGGDFYAVWDEESGLWSTKEEVAIKSVDDAINLYLDENPKGDGVKRVVKYMHDGDSGSIDKWHKYVQKQMREYYKPLDMNVIFSGKKTSRTDYASKTLSYELSDAEPKSYNKLMSVLYEPEERKKIEWAIGSIFAGDSKVIQKFIVLHGDPGSGKGTALKIIEELFEGYTCIFQANELTSSSNQFSTESFKSNPLVAIDSEADLSRIFDNTKLNMIVSHEKIEVNEKHKSKYTMTPVCFLFLATNKNIKITDSKSGLLRRLIDTYPSGKTVPPREYDILMNNIQYELGAIAKRCIDVYESMGMHYYSGYLPTRMIKSTDEFYDFMEYKYDDYKAKDKVTLTEVWVSYKEYCEFAEVRRKLTRQEVGNELRAYFREFVGETWTDDKRHIRNLYSGFLAEKFREEGSYEYKDAMKDGEWLIFSETKSLLDEVCKDYPAQYANGDGIPSTSWSINKKTLADIHTNELHYVKVPLNHIVVDFDIRGDDGEKSFEENYKAAVKLPPTYAELSKSGSGIHLHYIYDGDPEQLSRLYGPNVEIKVFTGDQALRRKLTKCNDIPIAHISSNLPLKGDNRKVIDDKVVKDEMHLKNIINKALRKEIDPPFTKPMVIFIKKVLDDAYASGINYDVTDMKQKIHDFARNSTNNKTYCINLVSEMKFASEHDIDEEPDVPGRLVFYDSEVFPDYYGINWKFRWAPNVVRLINPTPQEVEELLHFNLVDFNGRKYDRHIAYARLQGKTNIQLFNLSQDIIERHIGFSKHAYGLGFVDIFDMAAKKQSLKKWEIELRNSKKADYVDENGKNYVIILFYDKDNKQYWFNNPITNAKEFHDISWYTNVRDSGMIHKELGLPWDKPVGEAMFQAVAEYCDQDVIATEIVFEYLQGDFSARCMLAALAGMKVDTPTNTLTTRLIFGKEKHPQAQFNYRNMGAVPENAVTPDFKYDLSHPEYVMFTPDGKPWFPGYIIKNNKSIYRGHEPGEGGYVWAKHGVYYMVVTFDITSMHPTSMKMEQLFGSHTRNLEHLLDARVAIKKGDYEAAGKMLDGKLAPFLKDKSQAKALSQALKIAINSVYGLTAAKFENPFRDERNVDNIVAKRGALFMINLLHEVIDRGGEVVHIKTDSIKVVNPSDDISDFIIEFGKLYGYNFEIESVYEKFCLANNAVYIAKGAENDPDHPGQWTATGAQFAHPYVFKTLFSHEKIEFEDMCETKAVTDSLYLDMNEDLMDVSGHEKEYKKLISDAKKIGKNSDTDVTGYSNEDFVLTFTPEMYNYFKQLEDDITMGHDYVFVGRIGQFVPIKPGCKGGELMRKCKDGSYAYATGTKGYRWLESEYVREREKYDDIDLRYFQELADTAVRDISKLAESSGTNYEWFVSDENVPPFLYVNSDEEFVEFNDDI